MWGFIHVLYLVGWGNRLGTLYTWARAIWFSNNRGHRIITFESAREELAEGRDGGGAAAQSDPAQEGRESDGATRLIDVGVRVTTAHERPPLLRSTVAGRGRRGAPRRGRRRG